MAMVDLFYRYPQVHGERWKESLLVQHEILLCRQQQGHVYLWVTGSLLLLEVFQQYLVGLV